MGGGGGAGGYRSSVLGESSGRNSATESQVVAGIGTEYTVTIGAGGAGALTTEQGTNGQNSIFSTITSLGGGRGSNYVIQLSTPGTGGSGGGGSGNSANVNVPGGAGTAGQGFDGGTGRAQSGSNNDWAGGGGGGAGQNGAASPSGNVGGSGGNGLQSSISGELTYYAGGGGGCMGASASLASAGGLGGGGRGFGNNSASFIGGTTGENGVSNRGGGGGGVRDWYSGSLTHTRAGNGGSGVVILRYPSDYVVSIGAGLTGNTSLVEQNRVTVITAGTGNITFTE